MLSHTDVTWGLKETDASTRFNKSKCNTYLNE